MPAPSRRIIAKRFGLSKSQVTSILVAGEAEGYFALDVEGLPALKPRGRENYRRWVSIELAFYVKHMPLPQSPGGSYALA